MTSTPPASGGVAPILLFNGTGTSPNDVEAIETILNNNHLNYSSVNSAQLNAMGESQMQFAGWGEVVSKYPDGTPAVVEGTFGSGWVILSGVHPEAPERWRHGMTFATPGSEANACAGMLVRAALNRLSISHY